MEKVEKEVLRFAGLIILILATIALGCWIYVQF
jgi:hypothetical protein